MKGIGSWLSRKKFILSCALFTAVLLSVAGIQVLDTPAQTLPQEQYTLGIGERVITLGDIAYAAGSVDYALDGVADDVQFQAAVDALPATGGRLVVVSAATINFTAATTVTRAIDNITVEGSGQGTAFACDAATAIFTAGGNDWVFRDFSTDAGGLDMGATTGWTWERIHDGTGYWAYDTASDIGGASWDIPTGRSTTLIVAASDAYANSAAQADYICSGANDDVQLQAALDSLPVGGGSIHLTEGTFTLAAQVLRAIDDVAWIGSGAATLVNFNAANPVITAGAQDSWLFYNFGTDAGSVSIAGATNSAMRNVFVAGVRTDDPVASSGGLYGINVETLADDKTLTPDTDEIYQYLDEGGANRIITLDTASATDGDRFFIKHNGSSTDTHYLQIKQGGVNKDKIYAKGSKSYIFDGTNWTALKDGEGNISIGKDSVSYASGVSIGREASSYTYGVGIGYGAIGHTRGVAIGNSANGDNYGVAVGVSTDTNTKKYAIALGYKSETTRVAETSININGSDSDQENNVVQGRWEGQLAGGAGATEILCGGQAGERFTIRASSVLAFDMIITVRDNVAGEVARYSVRDGLIKRDAAGNTTMVLCTVTVDHEDDNAWDCAVTADDGNEALIITVTGDAANITQWAVVMNGVETHY